MKKKILFERVKKRSEKENRIDDKLDIFNARMDGYLGETIEVVRRLSELGPLIEINADDSKERISNKLRKSIKILI